MKKHIFTLASLLTLGTLSAQVRTVNSATNVSVTNSPAFIDASSNTTVNGSANVGKGLIFPRVDLSAMTAFPGVTAGIANSFPTRFDGMIVYNTASSGTAGVGATQGTLSPGYWYYENKTTSNTGGTWKPVSTATAAVANTASNGLTLAGNDVKLGGTLSQATTVTNNGNALNIAGSGSTSTFASNGYVGVGTTTPTSLLQTNGSFATRYVVVNSDTTLDGTFHTVNAVHNSGTVTLTLPPVTGVTGRQYVVQNNGNGTTNVVVSGNGTIEGQTIFTLNQVGQTAQLIAGNSEWQLVTNAIKSATVPSGANIYTADGTLSGNRIVAMGSNNLYFTGNGGINIGHNNIPFAVLDVNGKIGMRNSGSTVFGSLTTDSGNFLAIEAANSGNSTKYPVALAPYGGGVAVGHATSPQGALDVNGPIIARGTSSAYGSLNTNNGNFVTLEAYNYTNPSSKLPVALAPYGGGVAVGHATSPQGALDVNGPIIARGTSSAYGSLNTNNGNFVTLEAYNYTTPSAKLPVALAPYGGGVAIGHATSPQGALDVNGPIIARGTSSAYGSLNTNNGNFVTLEAYNYTNPSSKLPVTLSPYGGGVAIGHTTAPQGTLDVNGPIIARGTSSAYGSLNTNNGNFVTLEAYNYTNPSAKLPVALAPYGGGVAVGHATSPQGALDVNGPIIARGTSSAYGSLNTNNGNFVTLEAYNYTDPSAKLPVALAPYGGGVAVGTTTVNSGSILTVSGTMDASYIKLWNTINGGNRYVIAGNDGVLYAGNGYPSDARLKTNVKVIESGLKKVMTLRPVTYDWKKDAQMNDHKQLGFIAQELKKVVPEVVYTENRNGYKDLNTVNYEQLTALLTKAIQEQQAQIEQLKAENKVLTTEVNAIKKKLDR